MTKREQILAALQVFIAQRPGLEFGNYGDVAAYRSEMRSITKDRHTAERLLASVAWRTESIDEEALREAFRAYSGRLSIVDRADGAIALDYCAGQYFPTEYRRAACAVLASALWAAARENIPPDVERPGDVLRQRFAKEYGRRIANVWFN